MRLLSLILVATVAMSPLAFGQAQSDARIEVDTTEIPWHKTLTFSIITEAPDSASIEIAEMKNFGGLLTFGSVAIEQESLPNGRKRLIHRYILEAPEAKAGKFQPEPATVKFSTSETISVPSPEITVRELTPEEEAQAQQFAPALDPLNVPRRFWEYWQFWSGIAAAALIATALFAYFLWRTRMRPAVYERPLPPWETALQRLSALESKWNRDPAVLGPFYVELSAILRQYIEDRFAIHAPERTTPEFLAEASTRSLLSDDQQRMLASFLRYSDRVKFARHEPTVAEASQNLADVKSFIEQTIPAPATAQEEAA